MCDRRGDDQYECLELTDKQDHGRSTYGESSRDGEDDDLLALPRVGGQLGG